MWMLLLNLFHPARADQPCPASITALAEAHPAQIALADPRLTGPALVVIRKSNREILLYQGGTLATEGCWPAGLGFAPVGHKTREGDGRTPEGWYRTSDKPWSQWYHAIAIHYPSAEDASAGFERGQIGADIRDRIQRALARDEKPPQQTALGGEILIHGQGSAGDWTLGCVSMDNPDIDRLRALLPSGMQTDVLILP